LRYSNSYDLAKRKRRGTTNRESTETSTPVVFKKIKAGFHKRYTARDIEPSELVKDKALLTEFGKRPANFGSRTDYPVRL
jgi:hypothetical protein